MKFLIILFFLLGTNAWTSNSYDENSSNLDRIAISNLLNPEIAPIQVDFYSKNTRNGPIYSDVLNPLHKEKKVVLRVPSNKKYFFTVTLSRHPSSKGKVGLKLKNTHSPQEGNSINSLLPLTYFEFLIVPESSRKKESFGDYILNIKYEEENVGTITNQYKFIFCKSAKL